MSAYTWFTHRSRPDTGGFEPTLRRSNWVPVAAGAAVAGIAVLAYLLTTALSPPDRAPERAPTPTAAVPAQLPKEPTVADKVAAVDQHGGGSMEAAVAGLERRLAAQGGSDAEWELLAKSYEFLGRPADAAQARNKRVAADLLAAPAVAPAVAAGTGSAPAPGDRAERGVSVDGEVILADSLRDKVPPGLTLFIVAKSVNSPGPPVAILRTTTDAWPVHFRLDDTQAMLPQRNLSTAGLVTIEARTSKSGQAMPERGDFQGVTMQLDPAAGKPVRIVIARVIS